MGRGARSLALSGRTGCVFARAQGQSGEAVLRLLLGHGNTRGPTDPGGGCLLALASWAGRAFI
jgi:hypothetical protein